jgi:Flp pilus assembly protein TadD
VKSAVEFPFAARLGNALVAYAAYLVKTLYPLHLAVFYPHPGTALPLWQAAGAALLLAAITAAVLRSGKPYLVVGWLWYLGTLVPVIGLVQVGVQAMADRYTYVPLIGIFIMAAWGITDLTAGWRSRKTVLVFATVAGLAALTILTWFQVGTWRNNITLYSHAVKVTAGNYWAEYNLGLALMAGDRDDEALPHFQEAIRLQPGYADAYLNIGVIQAKQGRLDEAAANFRRVLELKPTHREALLNLSLALTRQGKMDEAAAFLGELRRLKPDDPEAWFLTGVLRGRGNEPSKAESAYREAIRLRPDYTEAHNNLGILLARQGRLEAAIGHFREALRIRPDYSDAKRNLDTALGEGRAPR